MATYYAWRDVRGRRSDGKLIYGIIPQFDGSRYASLNCGPACEAMRDVSQQQGVRPSKGSPWQPTAARIRLATGDTSGGTTPAQTGAATRLVYGIGTAAPRIAAKQDALDRLKAGYAVDLLVGYGPIDDYRSGSPGFRGNHRIVLMGRNTTSRTLLVADPLYDGRRTGIPQGQQWLPQSVVFDAASKLRLTSTTTLQGRYGYDDAFFVPSLTRLDPKHYRASVPAGSYMQYSVSSGQITGRAAKSTGGFSADCTAPRTYYWPGRGYYKLVRLTSGSRAGKYINAKYAREV